MLRFEDPIFPLLKSFIARSSLSGVPQSFMYSGLLYAPILILDSINSGKISLQKSAKDIFGFNCEARESLLMM